ALRNMLVLPLGGAAAFCAGAATVEDEKTSNQASNPDRMTCTSGPVFPPQVGPAILGLGPILPRTTVMENPTWRRRAWRCPRARWRFARGLGGRGWLWSLQSCW